MSQYSEEIERRRTFAIISHPDAGKTTLTETRSRRQLPPTGWKLKSSVESPSQPP